MRLSRYSIWMGVGCGLAGLAISAFAKADSVGGISLEAALPTDQAAILKADRQIFSTFKIPESNTALKGLLGTSSNSTADLIAWLEMRVQVLVSQDYDSSKNQVVLENHFDDYPNPGIYPTFETVKATTPAPPKEKEASPIIDPITNPVTGPTPPTPPSSTPPHVLMSNFGVSTYYTAKGQGELFGLVIDGVGTLPVHSPLVGTIQVGNALFDPDYFVDRANPASPANSILRLGTFFHEAHHSDGNGKSLGFFHAICPVGHSLAGLSACDRNLNGPYTVGAQIMQAMTENCTQCTKAQTEALRLQYLDSFHRVLPLELDGVTPIKAWDATPEGRR